MICELSNIALHFIIKLGRSKSYHSYYLHIDDSRLGGCAFPSPYFLKFFIVSLHFQGSDFRLRKQQTVQIVCVLISM